MQDNTENRLEFNKEKLSNLYSLYKVKIYIFIIILFLAASSFIFLNYLEKRKTYKLQKKYVQATLLLASNEKKKSKNFI